MCSGWRRQCFQSSALRTQNGGLSRFLRAMRSTLRFVYPEPPPGVMPGISPRSTHHVSNVSHLRRCAATTVAEQALQCSIAKARHFRRTTHGPGRKLWDFSVAQISVENCTLRLSMCIFCRPFRRALGGPLGPGQAPGASRTLVAAAPLAGTRDEHAGTPERPAAPVLLLEHVPQRQHGVSALPGPVLSRQRPPCPEPPGQGTLRPAVDGQRLLGAGQGPVDVGLGEVPARGTVAPAGTEFGRLVLFGRGPGEGCGFRLGDSVVMT